MRFASALPLLLLAACSHHDDAAASSGAGSWRTGHTLPNFVFEGDAATDASGRIWYLGGITGIEGDARTVAESPRVYVYDPRNDAWSDGPPLPVDAPKHHLAVVSDGQRIYVMGGFNGIIGGEPPGSFQPSAICYALDTTSGAWTRLADAPIARGAATAQILGGQIFVAAGGIDDNVGVTDLYSYDPQANAWTKHASMTTPREHVASCAANGKLIVAGGWNGTSKQVTGAVESYDPAADAWTTLPAMPSARGGLGGASLAGQCYFIGGERWDIPAPGTFQAIERLDPASGAWAQLAPMPTARHGIGVAVQGGSIYVIGGGPSQGNSYTDRVEIFSP